MALPGSMMNGTQANRIGISELTTLALIIGISIGGVKLPKKAKEEET